MDHQEGPTSSCPLLTKRCTDGSAMIRVRDGSRGGGLMVSFGKMTRGSRGVGGVSGKIGREVETWERDLAAREDWRGEIGGLGGLAWDNWRPGRISRKVEGFHHSSKI